MGYDRVILPPDRDEPETRRPWRRVLVAVIVVALFIAISIYAFSSW
ncbi:MAG: hypothetical protein ACRDZM_08860 [Acidimicrobiia bacterium]